MRYMEIAKAFDQEFFKLEDILQAANLLTDPEWMYGSGTGC